MSYIKLDDTHSVCFEDMTIMMGPHKFNLERYTNALNEICWRVTDKDHVLTSFMGLMMFQTKIELMYLTWVVERDLL